MKKFLLTISFVGFLFLGNAQKKETPSVPKNFIKTNLLSVALSNYSLQYERVLGEKFSLSLSYRFMPKTDVPFRNQIADFFDEYDDKEVIEALENLHVEAHALTPEFRFYFGQEGKGFYVSAYYRYANFGLESIPFTFNKTDGTEGNVKARGTLESHSGGIMFGKQWILGKNIVLDWWIIGGHIGSVSGTLKGYSQEDLGVLEQQIIRNTIEDFKYLDKLTFMDKNNAKVDVSGPWFGIRMGLSLGICF